MNLSMSGYLIRSLDECQNDILLMKNIARVYCDIWKEPPWYEDFWNIEIVLKDMKNSFSKRGVKCVFAQMSSGRVSTNPDQLIGFSWGYYMNREEFEAYSGNDSFPLEITNEDEVFYIAEMAVDRDWRQKSLAYQLSQALLCGCVDKKILLRTDKRAVAAQALYKKLGFTKTDLKDRKHTSRLYWCK